VDEDFSSPNKKEECWMPFLRYILFYGIFYNSSYVVLGLYTNKQIEINFLITFVVVPAMMVHHSFDSILIHPFAFGNGLGVLFQGGKQPFTNFCHTFFFRRTHGIHPHHIRDLFFPPSLVISNFISILSLP